MLGLDWWIWGALCLGVGALNTVFYPRDAVWKAGPVAALVIRWVHPLVWLLPAVSFFVRSAPGNEGVANWIAAIAGFFYLGFALTLARARRS
jgi:hypothetical protein